MICAAILAGGIGERLGLGIPKQFHCISGKPLLIHCVENFVDVEELDLIIVSSPKEYVEKTKYIINEFVDDSRIHVIEGGITRNDTILNSIDFSIECGANENSIMVTHDCARIFVSSKLIRDSIHFALKYGASSAVIPATDVIFQSKSKGLLSDVPERKYLVHAQTPQAFNIKKFMGIYNDLSKDEIKLLDEAMVLFFLRNENVYLFDGDSSNFKITRPFDLTLAETYLKNLK
ncbi:2-C-methyl-D-erythritol 4-phosphate cytidylyltransferase [Methanobrevibacter sp.]|uniref:IspD/TarI family cytidylyltransferase n=1 Tax=Methanobrevibacter sp. TaxID=66852 RepID=UPI0038909FAF